MKNFFKILGFIVLGTVFAAYLCFLFVLPNVIDLNQYTPLIKDLAKEQAKLDIDYKNAKIITTPLLGAGIKAENISVKLPDGSVLFSADGFKTRVALPSLFLLTAKVSCFEIDNPFVNLEIDKDNKDYKVVKLVEDILNENKAKTFAEEQVVTESWFNPEWIRIKVPCVKLNNYKVLITDLKSKHYLDLHGEELRLSYFNGKVAKIKTYAELFSDENKNITANIDINTFIPKTEPSLDKEDDLAERIDIPFINPVEMYRNYDLKADLDTKLKIRNHDGDLSSFGYFNIDGVTMKVSHLQLPESYIHAKMFAHNLDLDTNIYAMPEQNIQLLGELNYSKNPKLDMNIKASVKHNDLLILAKAFLDSLSIKNELSSFKAQGSTKADCYIKTNFKKLKSNGYIKVENGGIAVRNLGNVISNANINISLDNDILSFVDSNLLVNKSKVYVDGKIGNDSVADIKIETEKLPLPVLFNAFAPSELRNSFKFRSGDVTLKANLNGKLKESVANAQFGLDNFDFADRKNTFRIKNDRLSGEFTNYAKTNSLAGSITNKNFAFNLPVANSSVRVPDLTIGIADKNISIKEDKLFFNDKSEIKFSGDILDYEKLKSISINADGAINTDDMIKLIGREFKRYIHSQGDLKLKLSVNGDKKKQTLLAQVLADKDNFITPVEFTELGGKQTSLQSIIDFKHNRIKIKKTGLYIRTTSVDEEGNEIVKLDDVIDIDGTVAGDRINLIKINMPKILSGKIYVFPNSSLIIDKSKLYIYGASANPVIRGAIKVREINIPELLTSVNEVNTDFRGHRLNFNLQNILLNGSDISVNGDLDLNPNSVLNITGLNVTSGNINLDKLMKVSDLAMKYVPQTPSNNNAKSAQTPDIPVTVQNGSINMRRITTGNIEVLNTTSRLALRRNILALRNLNTNIFKGQVNGDIFVDLIKILVEVDLQGKNIDVEKAMLDAAGMKDMLSGTASFDAKLSIDGAAQTLEAQMKGITGDVNFNVVDGIYGPFGKIENLIIAQNIRESQFFQTALGGVINSLATIDTTHFSELAGHLSFENGICHIDPITSLGNILSLHIFGDFDLVQNYADMKVRAKMASVISNLLGPLNAINPINLVNSAASLNVVTAKAFSIFCEVVPPEEFDIIPSFSNGYVDNSATKFQLGVRGDVAKPLTLIKSFKWLASQTQYDNAVEFVNSLPEEIEGSTATNIEEAIAEAKALEEEKKTLKYKLKHLFSKDETNKTVKVKEEIIETVQEVGVNE